MARRRICALLLAAAATASADVNETATTESRARALAAQSYDWLADRAPAARAFAEQHGPGFVGGAITALLCMLLAAGRRRAEAQAQAGREALEGQRSRRAGDVRRGLAFPRQSRGSSGGRGWSRTESQRPWGQLGQSAKTRTLDDLSAQLDFTGSQQPAGGRTGRKYTSPFSASSEERKKRAGSSELSVDHREHCQVDHAPPPRRRSDS